MANDPILHLLGLARKAGRLEVGEERQERRKEKMKQVHEGVWVAR